MRWHYKLGHYFLKWILSLMRAGHDGQPPMIPTPTNSQAHFCDTAGFLCALCQYGICAQIGTGSKHVIETDPLTNMSPRSRDNCLTPKAKRVHPICTLGALSSMTMPPS
eukprot:14724346-Ditylum_brightwellii.AAC.1